MAAASAGPGTGHSPLRPGAGRATRQGRLPWVLLVVLVLWAHLWALNRLAQDRLGAGAAEPAPTRMNVAFVRDLAQQAPARAVAPVPTAAPVAARLPAVVAAGAASASASPSAAAGVGAGTGAGTGAGALALADAPSPAASAPANQVVDAPPQVAADLPATALPPVPPLPVGAAAAVVTAPLPAAVPALPAAASASVAPVAGFNWPPSTRLSFKLQGHYQGPVEGSARVEWVRQGSRYQVRLDSSAGPLFSRKVLSEGELGDAGLVPQRFSGEQRVLFASPRRWSLTFSPEQTTLSDGRSVPAQAGQQDEASQFVQITWLFSTRPELLQVGRSVEFPLAISRRLERWTFDVVAQETLRLPLGEVDTFHVKPRREAAAGDMSAEMWIAPSLQYLPVRILIRQRDQHWVDLTLARAPQQAAP